MLRSLRAVLLRPLAALACAMIVGCATKSADDARACAQSAADAVALARTIAMPGVGGDEGGSRPPGRLDHMAYDAKTGRLFVAAVANGSLEVVDLERGVHVQSIGGLAHPQGTAIAPDSRKIVVACGDAAEIRAFDVDTLQEVGRRTIGDDPDNVRFVAGHFYVGYGNDSGGAIAKLDPTTLATIAEVPLKAHPESFQLTPDGSRVYVNVPFGKTADVDGSIVVADFARPLAESSWTLAETARNFPMALDDANGRLFVASRKPATLLALDLASGKVLSKIPCVDSDDIFVDPESGLVIVIGADRQPPYAGAVEFFSLADGDRLERVRRIDGLTNARTGYFSTERRALYVAVPKSGAEDAEIREYRFR